MLRHTEKRSFPYNPKDLFDLVLDIGSYPEFLSGCKAARITSKTRNAIFADLVVGHLGKSIKYTSKILTSPPKKSGSSYMIMVSLVEGPFEKLDNNWKFTWDNATKCTIVEFEINFKMNSAIFQNIISLMFEKLLLKMIDSFEDRAKKTLERSDL